MTGGGRNKSYIRGSQIITSVGRAYRRGLIELPGDRRRLLVAQSARRRLQNKWDEGLGGQQSSAAFAKGARELSTQNGFKVLRKGFDVDAA